jgi:hypothetical protein
MRSLIAVVLFLLAGISTSIADQPIARLNAAVDTEAGAEAVLERTIMRIEAAVPALTPEEQRYVRQETEFADAMGKQAGGIGSTYTSERVNAFLTTKQFYEWEVHREMVGLREDLDTVHKIRSSDARFALWAFIVMRLLSTNEATENALNGLSRLGVINRSDLGPAEGVSWLAGTAEGRVQLYWSRWADTMWYA